MPVAGKIFDIDSLNEIKKANDLASKKVEITNHIFELLVGEIKNNLFPMRDEEEEFTEDPSGSRVATKKKKRRVARRVLKPSMLPKIKELKNGQPVDMCLKRI